MNGLHSMKSLQPSFDALLPHLDEVSGRSPRPGAGGSTRRSRTEGLSPGEQGFGNSPEISRVVSASDGF